MLLRLNIVTTNTRALAAQYILLQCAITQKFQAPAAEMGSALDARPLQMSLDAIYFISIAPRSLCISNPEITRIKQV